MMHEDQRRNELAHFLRIRRERLLPAQFHLTDGIKRRRTPGLRREELAQIAGIGLTWYTKLEQGQDIRVSEQMLESLAQTLQLTPDERVHLFVLARGHPPLPARTCTHQLGVEHQRLLNDLNPNPAYVTNDCWDIIGWNQAASSVFSDFAALSLWERNLVWIILTHPSQRTLVVNWECVAQRMVGLFRASGARDPGASWFIERRDRLLEVSPAFRDWWTQYDVGEVNIQRKDLHHPLVGRLSLQSTIMQLLDVAELKFFIYTPLPENDTASKIRNLLCLSQTNPSNAELVNEPAR